MPTSTSLLRATQKSCVAEGQAVVAAPGRRITGGHHRSAVCAHTLQVLGVPVVLARRGHAAIPGGHQRAAHGVHGVRALAAADEIVSSGAGGSRIPSAADFQIPNGSAPPAATPGSYASTSSMPSCPAWPGTLRAAARSAPQYNRADDTGIGRPAQHAAGRVPTCRRAGAGDARFRSTFLDFGAHPARGGRHWNGRRSERRRSGRPRRQHCCTASPTAPGRCSKGSLKSSQQCPVCPEGAGGHMVHITG